MIRGEVGLREEGGEDVCRVWCSGVLGYGVDEVEEREFLGWRGLRRI